MFFKKKSLGQNFLRSKGVISHIISAAKIKKGDLVLEIGPGEGFLTKDLIDASGNVLSVEKDDRLIGYLENKFQERVESGEWRVVHGDILDFTLDRHPREGGDPSLPNYFIKRGSQTKSGMTLGSSGMTTDVVNYKVVANIPYYITGQIIRKFLTAKNKPISMTIMVQKEVAQRIAGPASAKGYGVAMKESILSLSVKLFGDPVYVKTVKKENFSPVPNVDSAILLIENISQKYFDKKSQEVIFFEIIKKAFNQKRKKISSTLKNYELQLKKAKIDPNKRPEDLKIEDWVRLIKEID